MRDIFNIENFLSEGIDSFYSPGFYDPILEYLEIISNEYIPLNPVDYDYVTKGIGDFAYRYLDNKIDKSFEQKFLDNKDVQKTITAMGYDVEKFWYLLLFIYDYSCGMCVKGIERKQSPKDQITTLCNAIMNNVETYIKAMPKVTFKSPAKITLEIKGKHKIIIDDPNTIYYLALMCTDKINEIGDNSLLSISLTPLLGNNDLKSNSVHIWYFAQMFFKFFELKPPIRTKAPKGSIISYSRKLLVSRLIYIVGLSKNKNLLDSDDTLKGFLNQYKDYKLDVINGIYY